VLRDWFIKMHKKALCSYLLSHGYRYFRSFPVDEFVVCVLWGLLQKKRYKSPAPPRALSVLTTRHKGYGIEEQRVAVWVCKYDNVSRFVELRLP